LEKLSVPALVPVSTVAPTRALTPVWPETALMVLLTGPEERLEALEMGVDNFIMVHEVDSLLDGLDSGEVETQADEEKSEPVEGINAYDFTSQDKSRLTPVLAGYKQKTDE